MASSQNGSSYKANDLRPLSRFITDHNTDAKAVFSTQLADEIPVTSLPNGAQFRLGYTTDGSPVSLAGASDVDAYAARLDKSPGIVVPGGTVARFVDVPPSSLSPMHRTVSLDYGVVIEGEVELVLDSGETRLLRRGDLAIQRGTMHAWRNASTTEWARMLYVLQECRPVVIDGKKLGEDYGDMEGVPKSGN